MSSLYYTVEIPHQRQASVIAWFGKQAALENYLNDWYESASFESEEPQTEDEILEWAGHDLNYFRAFESLEELEAWARAYAHDSRAGGSGGHQSLRVLALVEQMLEEVQA